MPTNPDEPTVEQIIADLRVLRERGLVRLRHTDLGDLRKAAARAGLTATAGGHQAVEALLRAAVQNLGSGQLGSAAMATFGLDRANGTGLPRTAAARPPWFMASAWSGSASTMSGS